MEGRVEDKQTRVRHWLLDRIDGVELAGGDKLPGARDIGERLEVSLLTVQNALETLVNEGVLESYPRKGTFVAHKWRKCVLQNNFRSNNPALPWLEELKNMVSENIPRLYFCSGFDAGMLELRPTLVVQSCRDQYMDLREMFERCFPDRSDFFMEAFSSYYSPDGSLPGIPFIFSPRIMLYNTELLERAGCPLPRRDWTWDEFIDSVTKLKRILPGKQIFNWNADLHQWMGLVFRAGGKLFEPADKDDQVRLDHPATLRGLRLFRQLQHLLGSDAVVDMTLQYRESFARGELAFMLSPRQDLFFIKDQGFDTWGSVPFPLIPEGSAVTTQAADLLCVRKSCSNLKMAEDFIRLMLSDEIQRFIGSRNYGIPIRKSAAIDSISRQEARDWLFMEEIPHMSAQYHLDSAEIMNMVLDGINQIWHGNEDIAAFCSELAAALRTFMKIRKTAGGTA